MGVVYCRASGPVVGIVNGMDIGDWSPLVDKYITQRYGKDTVAEGKQKNKEAVQAVLGLPVRPLVGMSPLVHDRVMLHYLRLFLPELRQDGVVEGMYWS